MSSKKGVVYVVTAIVSPYKEDSEDPETFLFRYEEKARRFMREYAKKLFYQIVEIDEESDSENEGYDSGEGSNDVSERPAGETRPIRQRTPPSEGRGSCGHYFYEGKGGISFGEDKSMGECYRRAWGSLTIAEEAIDEDP